MLIIPEQIWMEMLAAFRAEKKSVERVAYLDGISCDSFQVVTTLTIPNAKLAPLRFEVPSASMSEAGKHLRANKLLRLAQVHTHPTEWTDHSPWDDKMAYSQMDGAISIVLPFHARKGPRVHDSGVHVRGPTGWRRLLPEQLKDEVRMVPSFLDFRKKESALSKILGGLYGAFIQSPRR